MTEITISFAILDSRTAIDRLNNVKKANPELLSKLVDWFSVVDGVEASDFGFFLASLLGQYKESEIQLFANEYNKWNEMLLRDSPICAGTCRFNLLDDVNQAIDRLQFTDEVKFKTKRWLAGKKGIIDTYAIGFYLGKILIREQDTTRLDKLMSISSLDEVIAWFALGVAK